MLKCFKKSNQVYKKFVKTISNTYTRLCMVDSVENGVLVPSSEFREFDNSNLLNHTKHNDFSVANLIATGNEKFLRNCSFASNVVNFSDSVDNFLNSVKDVKEEK